MAEYDLQTRTALTASDFGTVGSGAVDDHAALQDMINHLETQFFAAYDSGELFAVSPAVRIPSGRYLISEPLVISAPITLIGASPFSTIIQPDDDFAVFEVRGTLSASAYSTDNMHPTIAALCILGGSTVTDTSQHGVYVRADADRRVTRVWIDNCQIRSMGASGLFSETAVSNKVTNSNIALCDGPGIHLTGEYNTDIHFVGNSIRRNLIGIKIEPDTGEVFSSGRICHNLIESNRNGSGQVGSSTRPAVGLWMTRAQQIEVSSNYFESHLNDIYVHGNASYCTFERNRHDGGGNLVPGLYTGFGGPARQAAPMYFADTDGFSLGVTIEGCWLYRPSKPAATADADWGTGTWGAEYEHLPVLQCQQLELIRNKWIDPAVGVEGVNDILYNAPDSHVRFEGIRRASGETRYRTRGGSADTRESDRLENVATLSVTHEFTDTTGAGTVRQIYPHDTASSRRIVTTLSRRNADGTLTDIGDMVQWRDEGPTFPFALGYGMLNAASAVMTHRVGTAAPTTGTWVVGSKVWNSAPSLDGNNMIILGWVCRIAGTPGSWSPMYVSAVSPAT